MARSADLEPIRLPPPRVTFGGGGSNTLAGGGGETLSMGPNEKAVSLQYANQEAIRDRQLNDRLSPILATAAAAAGVDDIRVISGGQPATGVKGVDRTGSHRHDFGRAGDIQLLVNGRVLDFNDPNDRPIFEKFISTAVAAGAKGVGAGSDYMGTKTIHVGFGGAGAWGAKGKGSNAPEWLTAAFEAGRALPNVAVDPAAVAAFEAGAPQFTDAQSAIASLIDPTGGTLTPSIPAGTEAYAPFRPAEGPTPAASPDFDFAAGPGPTFTPPSRTPDFDFAAGPGPTFTPPSLTPDIRGRPEYPGALPAGMPPPPSRPVPAASMANMPAMVGMPPSAPPGGVGAFSPPGTPSDLVPFLPPPAATAGAPAASPGDDRVAAIQSIIDQGVTDPNEIWGNLNMDRDGNLVGDITSAEIQAVLDRGQRNAPDASSAIADEFGPGTPFSQVAPATPPWQPYAERMRMGFSNADTQASLDTEWPPLAATPSPWSDPSRAFDIPPPITRMAEFGPSPRPNITPDFDFAAGPGPTFTPPSLAPDIRGRPEYPGFLPPAPNPPISGGGGSDAVAAGNASPLLPPPVTTRPMPEYPLRYGDKMLNKEGEPIFNIGTITNPSTGQTMLVRDRASGAHQQLTDEDLAFGLSRGWQIEHQAPLPQGREGDAYAKAYGGIRPPSPSTAPPPPDLATQLGIHNIATAAPEIPYDPLSSARLNLPPSVPAVPSLDDIPGVTVATDPNNITLPPEPTSIKSAAQVAAEQAPTIDPVVAAANMPVVAQPAPRQPIVKAAAAAAAAPAKTTEEEKKRNSFLSRLLPGGGSIFGIGPNGFFSNAGSFTPFAGAGAGGSSPFNMQPNGTMGSTTWRQGSVTGNPAMSGVMWNRSGNNGSVGYVTNPFNDSMIYSGSPNRF